MSKLGILCYIAPPNLVNANAFFTNIKNFPPKNELIIYSDYDYSKEWPGMIKLAASPEVAKTDKNKMAVHNLVFYIGLRIAAGKGYSHVLILEHDCRVNVAGWDELLFQEFMSKNVNAIAGGSIAIFNPCSYNQTASRRFEKFLIETASSRVAPLSVTGSSNLAEHRDSCVFPNGAFAIYKLDWWIKKCPEITGSPDQYIKFSQDTRTWDYHFAVLLWDEFKERAYDQVVSLDNVYSGYGNVMSTEEERMGWLKDRKIVGVHQIKSNWPGPEPVLVESAPKSTTSILAKKVQLFIVTYAKDFSYLEYCLRSIKKFAIGFSGVTILVPTKDVHALRTIVGQVGLENVTVKSGYEWKDKGMLWHMAMLCRADEFCPDADYIAHWDADCIFTAPVFPDTFFKDGNPLLRYEPFESLAKRHPGIWNWKVAAENALPFSVADEFMRGHPEVYARATYEKTRQLIEEKHKVSFNGYVRSCKNSYPQTFAEHPALGAVAAAYFSDSYCLSDCSRQDNPDKSPYPTVQFWSHRPPDQEQEIVIYGIKRTVIPNKLAEEILKD
jgi:hypothetical protein